VGFLSFQANYLTNFQLTIRLFFLVKEKKIISPFLVLVIPPKEYPMVKQLACFIASKVMANLLTTH
jgi:hypothetical protein